MSQKEKMKVPGRRLATKLADKRFWIFEAFTILYAIGLMGLGYMVWGNSSVIEFQLFILSLCCISGLITWVIANRKHWFILGLVYEAIFLLLISICLWIEAMTSNNTVNVLFDIDLFSAFVLVILLIAAVSFVPSIVLAFIYYHLFNMNNEHME